MATFKYVLIPADSGEMVELHHTAVDTLANDDPFIATVKRYFTNVDAKVDKATLIQNLQEHGKGVAPSVPEEMLDKIMTSTSVDLFPLAVPMKDNGFHGVTLYCDDKGIAKSLARNSRAISLAEVIGYPGQNFRGDVFLGRTFDDDNDWRRVDFCLSDCSSSANWVAHQTSLRVSQGSKMSSLSSLTASLGGGGPAVMGASPPQITQQALQTGGEEKEFKWSQNEEEVELQVPAPQGVVKKDVSVKFGLTTLEVSVLGKKIAHGTLGGKIVCDGCTWTLVDNMVQITLEKHTPAPWSTVIAE